MMSLSVSRLRRAKSLAVSTAKLLALVGPALGLLMPSPAAATRMFTYRGIATFQADNGAPPMPGPRRFVARYAYADDRTPLWSDLWVGNVQRWTTDCPFGACNPLVLGAKTLKSGTYVTDEDEAVIVVTSPGGFGGHDPWLKPFSYVLTPADTGLAAIWFVDHPTGGWYATYTGGITSFSVTSVPEPASWGLMLIGFGGIGAALRKRRTRQVAASPRHG
jgi:hypothetical protein